jgi:hypothetical protein
MHRVHGESDFWKNHLQEPMPHVRNKMRPDDYLDDMRWAEDRRGRGWLPEQRAKLDMPMSDIL